MEGADSTIESATSQTSDSQATKRGEISEKHSVNAGMARIKPEFVLENHKRTMTEKYLPNAAVEEIKKLTDDTPGKRASDNSDSDVPQKKAKLRGRNKKRPHDRTPQAKDKLCPSVVAQVNCNYGDACKFSHDVAQYVERRLPPHSDQCYLYDTFGKCHFGVTCLCADVHTGDNYEQLVNEELWSKYSDKVLTTNKLPAPLMRTLNKKKYNFGASDRVISAINGGKTVTRECIVRPERVKGGQADSQCGSERTGVSQNSTKVIENGSIDSNQDCLQNQKTEVEGNQMELGDLVKVKTEKLEETSINCENRENLQGVSIKNENKFCDVTLSETGDTAETKNVLGNNVNNTPQENSFKSASLEQRLATLETAQGEIKLRPQEIKKVDFRDKLYLAPLTTVGNLPFRRICKQLGADITCSEMATATGLLQGHKSEWALLKRHHTEDLFGAQVCGSNVEVMTRCAQVLMENTDVNFIDINCGCPIDLFYKKGEGCALMAKNTRLQNVVKGMTSVMDVPLTVKMRTGIFENKYIADKVIANLRDLDVAMVTLHGRSREQRYTRSADWDYIQTCSEVASPMPLFGNGDVLSFEEYNLRRQTTGVAGCLIARGALMKPWLFTEIKEQRDWDISSGERLDLLRDFCHYGLEHWGSDMKGVQTTRRFLLEWLSFLYRYIPVGVLEQVPQKINQKPPRYVGRNDLETLMASPNCADWIKISEMLLGPVPDDFQFLPKHKANSYQ